MGERRYQALSSCRGCLAIAVSGERRGSRRGRGVTAPHDGDRGAGQLPPRVDRGGWLERGGLSKAIRQARPVAAPAQLKMTKRTTVTTDPHGMLELRCEHVS